MDPDTAQVRWKKVKELFHEALRQDSGQRNAFLDHACDGDTQLRIEVESLLISFAEAETFLEEPVMLTSSRKSKHWQFNNQEVVSHYRILEPIGAGGMAEVYLAEDSNLHRQVALKVLPNELLRNPDRLRRFKREALAVSALNHPNILTIFEFDSVDGINLLASEYVDGKTLREILRGGPIEIPSAIEIAIQIVSALNTAHTAGVIHRDIKPENIMIRDDGYVKVLDFGLAKLTGDMRQREAATAHSPAFSQPGLIMGTATYMSPEQARCGSIDSRTDIFSFGVMLYEMVAGTPPFTGETTTDIIAEIIQKDPPKVSTHNPAVTGDLDRIIDKCLAKDRRDRYETAADLLAELKKIAKPIAVTVDQVEGSPNIEDATPNQPRIYFLLGIVAFVIVLATIYWYLA